MPGGRSHTFWRKLAESRVFVLPALLLAAVTLPHFGQGDFRGDAGWYSAIGLQAWRTGNLWTLWAEPGQPYFNKPPLGFWIHGLALHLLGPSVWAARLPTLAAALGCVLVTVAIARDLAGRRAALFSGIILALSLEFFRRTREISLDMWQALFLLLAAWALVRAVRERPTRGSLLALCGAPIGLALLTKPLTAILFFPLALVWLAFSGRARSAGWLALGLLLALAIAAPWHLSMIDLHGREFIAQYFGVEIAERARGNAIPGHATPPRPWFYFEKLAEHYWPWLLAAVLSVIVLARGQLQGRHKRAAAFGALWFAYWLLLLTLYPDRRDRYSIPLYPGLAILGGTWLAWAPERCIRRAQRATLRAAGPAAAAAASIVALLPIRLQDPPSRHWPEVFAWMQSNGTPELWQGAAGGAQGARFYLEFGRWPVATRNRWGGQIAAPPAGAYLLYHDRGGYAPGPGETELFRASDDDLVITRLEEPHWRPTPIADPGD